jgi:hypothetical protein
VTLERVDLFSRRCARWSQAEEERRGGGEGVDVNSIAWSWDAFFSELAMLAISQHANVVRLYGAHSRRTSLRPFIVMELASGTVADMIDVAGGARRPLHADDGARACTSAPRLRLGSRFCISAA